MRPGEHIAIVSTAVALALQSGSKRIESRLTRTRRAPFGRIAPGDRIHFKLSGGPLIGSARVRRVGQWSGLTPARIRTLRRTFGAAVAAPPGYWRVRRGCRFGVLLWIGPMRAAPRMDVPRQFGSGWIVLDADG